VLFVDMEVFAWYVLLDASGRVIRVSDEHQGFMKLVDKNIWQ
jgi:hypothetical protein